MADLALLTCKALSDKTSKWHSAALHLQLQIQQHILALKECLYICASAFHQTTSICTDEGKNMSAAEAVWTDGHCEHPLLARTWPEGHNYAASWTHALSACLHNEHCSEAAGVTISTWALLKARSNQCPYTAAVA